MSMNVTRGATVSRTARTGSFSMGEKFRSKSLRHLIEAGVGRLLTVLKFPRN